jgi:photosystem II stability/assembly factor-like uncharacterized protein
MKRCLNVALVLVFLLHFPGRPVVAENLPPAYTLRLPQVMNQFGLAVTRIGPDIGRPLGVVQDPFNASILYTYTVGSGIYKSIDAGHSWFPSSKGIGYLVMQSLAADPANPGVLYAGTFGDLSAPYNGVYKSLDYGASWAQTGEMGNTWNGAYYKNPVVYAIEVDPNNSQRIFAATRMRDLPGGALGGGGVFRSQDGGKTWKTVNTGLPGDQLYAYDLELNPASPGTLYVTLHGSPPGGVYKSTNAGDSWSQVFSKPEGLDGRALKVDPFNPGLLYYGAATFQGFWRYTANAWTRMVEDWNVHPRAIFTDPYHQGRVFIGIDYHNGSSTPYGLARSNDSGASWIIVDTGNVSWDMAFSPDGQTSFLAYDWDGVYQSQDGGLSWNRSSSGLTGYSVTSVVVHPTNPAVLYATTYGGGVKYSQDGGLLWKDASFGMLRDANHYIYTTGLAINPSNNNVVYAITDGMGVYYTETATGPWRDLNVGYPSAPAAGAINGLSAAGLPGADPLDNRPLPALDTDVPRLEPASLDVSPQAGSLAGGNLITFSPFDGSLLIGTSGRGLIRFDEYEVVWAPTGLSSGSVYALAFDLAAPGRMLAGMDAASGSLMVSTNHGQVWSPSSSGLAGRTVLSLAQSHANPLVFLAGTDNGLYASTNGGASWALAGLSGQVVKGAAVHSSTRDPLYLAGSSTHAYYSFSLAPGSWSEISPAFQYAGVQMMLRDPSSQSVYVASRLAGILKITNR